MEIPGGRCGDFMFRSLNVQLFDYYIVGQMRFLCRVGRHRFRCKIGLYGELHPTGLNLVPKIIPLFIAQIQIFRPAVIQRHHFEGVCIGCVFDGFAPVVKLHRLG